MIINLSNMVEQVANKDLAVKNIIVNGKGEIAQSWPYPLTRSILLPVREEHGFYDTSMPLALGCPM